MEIKQETQKKAARMWKAGKRQKRYQIFTFRCTSRFRRRRFVESRKIAEKGFLKYFVLACASFSSRRASCPKRIFLFSTFLQRVIGMYKYISSMNQLSVYFSTFYDCRNIKFYFCNEKVIVK